MMGLHCVFTLILFQKLVFGYFDVAKFENFILQYNKSYGSREEYQKRLLIFSKNMEKARQLQEEELGTARYGVTQFSDLADDETCGYNLKTRDAHEYNLMNNYTSEDSRPFQSCDWRKRGAISSVKNQGQLCGSCWAFAVVGNIEAQFSILGQPKNLSVQQVVDCNTCGKGCHGSFTWDGFITVLEQGGLAEESSYQYNGKENKCKKRKVNGTIAGFEMVSRNEKVMSAHLANKGTLTVIINQIAIKYYTGGVIDRNHTFCDHNLVDHAVLIVGYNKDEKGTHWILKNSWGSKWGENGYFRMRMGKNVCGITKYPLTALLSRETKGVRCPTDES